MPQRESLLIPFPVGGAGVVGGADVVGGVSSTQSVEAGDDAFVVVVGLFGAVGVLAVSEAPFTVTDTSAQFS